MTQRKRHTPEFKAKIAIEAIRGDKTANQIASEYGVHTTQVSQWKKQALEQMARGFDSKVKKSKAEGPTTDQLYSQNGQLKVELDWLKKKSTVI